MAGATMQHLATQFLAGLIEHDLDRMHAALAPTATWSVPGGTAVSGVAEGAVADGRITAAKNLISDVPMLDAFFVAGRS